MTEMIRILICALLMTFGIVVSAQNTLLEPGMSWTYIEGGVHMEDENGDIIHGDATFKASIVGDTIVDGRVCALCNNMIMYEEDGQVFLYIKNYSGGEAIFSPVMTFNVEVGQRLPCFDSGIYPVSDYCVTEVKQMKVEGIDRRVIGLRYTGWDDESEAYLDFLGTGFYWIEGVGSPQMIFQTMFPRPTGSRTDHPDFYGLQDVYFGEQLIFSRENWEQQMSGVEAVRTEAAIDADAPVYDLQGRQVKQLQPGRVYIQGSRKFRR